jgi:hypothetical protein
VHDDDEALLVLLKIVNVVMASACVVLLGVLLFGL